VSEYDFILWIFQKSKKKYDFSGTLALSIFVPKTTFLGPKSHMASIPPKYSTKTLGRFLHRDIIDAAGVSAVILQFNTVKLGKLW
jgi:hypothetical protein